MWRIFNKKQLNLVAAYHRKKILCRLRVKDMGISMEFVTIELRPRLRSCNVFVSLRNGTDPNRIRVKLNKDHLTLRVDEESYNLSLVTIRIIPNSLSCLRVDTRWVSFRIQTAPLDSMHGSFVAELLQPTRLKIKDSVLPLTSLELPPKERDLIFLCSCCDNRITGTVRLNKVLPLPNNNCDPGDFFCCSHNGADYSKLLEPSVSHYFYGPDYVILNRENFSDKLKINKESVVCNRCLSTIGVPNSDFSLQIWNCSMEYGEINDKIVKTNKRSNPLADFKMAVKNCYVDGFTNDRILLEAKDSKITHYLLIKPMEWNLDLLVEPREIDNTKPISLSNKKCIKVLYNYGEKKPSLINDFEDIRVVKTGLKSMLAGMEHLLISSRRIPPIYRKSDEYHIGYMSLDISDKT